MGDHYLPQHYLKGFAANERFWVYDLELGKSRPGQPKSEANVNGLWPGELEKHLAQKIEGPAIGIIDRIRQRQPIEAPEKEILAQYLLTMWKRVPAAKGRTFNNVPKVAEGTRARVQARLDLALAFNPDMKAEREVARRQVDELLDRYIANPPDHLWHNSVGEDNSPLVMGALMQMEWTFLVSSSDPFLTCDDPFFYFTKEGVGHPNAEVSIPLSSTITLLAHRQGEQRRQYKDARQNTVVQLNRRTAFNARRFMYSEMPLEWALKLGKHKPKPSRIKVSAA